MRGQVGQPWPLVGRDDELDLLTGLVLRPDGPGAVVAGAAGVGKTRIAAEVATRWTASGRRVQVLVATRSVRSVPLGVFAPVLREPVAGASAFDVLRQAADAIAQLAAERELLLVLDDANLLDEASAAVALQLATAHDAPMLVTIRTGEPSPDAVTTMWRDRLIERVDLQPLSNSEVRAAVEIVLGGPVADHAHRLLWETSAGNLLYLRELVTAALSAGNLEQRGGIWTWSGSVPGSDRLNALIGERLGSLPQADRSTLELLAVAEPLPVAAVASATPGVALDHAIDAGLVTVDGVGPDAAARLAHPLYAETLRASMRSDRAAHWAGVAANALAPATADDQLRIALLRLEAGQAVPTEEALAAARRSMALGDVTLADRLGRIAAEGGAGSAAAAIVVEAEFWLGHHDEVLELVAATDLEQGDPEDVCALKVNRASALCWGLGRPDDAEASLRIEAGAWPDLDEWGLLAQAHRVTVLAHSSRHPEAPAAAERVLAHPACTDRVRVRAAAGSCWPLALAGHIEAARTQAQEAIQLALGLPQTSPTDVGLIVVRLAVAELLGGQTSAVDEFIGPLYEDSVKRRGNPATPMCLLLLGRAALFRGELDDAVRGLREATELIRLAPLRARAWAWAVLAIALGQQGDAAGATAAHDVAMANQPLPDMAVELGLARAWASAAAGAVSAAQAIAVDTGRELQDAGVHAAAMVAGLDALRLGAGPPAVELLETSAAHVDGALAPASLLAAQAVRHHEHRELRAAAEGFADLRMWLVAAELAVMASEAARDAGLRVARGDHLTRAHTLLDRCGTVRTPALAPLSADPAASFLTAREREVATLAAAGRTKREIGLELGLASKTVSNHLNHVYAKLGVGDREGLRTLLEDSAPQRHGEVQ